MGRERGGAMQTDDANPCMATRSNVLTRGCPNRRTTSLTKLSGYVTSPSWNKTVLSNGKKVGFRLQRQVASRKPPTNIEELNTETRGIIRSTRAGMAGPTNTQHPKNQTPEKPQRPLKKQEKRRAREIRQGGNTWSYHASAMNSSQNAPLGMPTSCI